jgi:hypothetical protein
MMNLCRGTAWRPPAAGRLGGVALSFRSTLSGVGTVVRVTALALTAPTRATEPFPTGTAGGQLLSVASDPVCPGEISCELEPPAAAADCSGVVAAEEPV